MNRTGLRPLTARKPTTLEAAAAALYALGGAGTVLSVPHPAVIAVTLAETGLCTAVFAVIPVLLRRHAPGSRRGAP